MAHLYHGMIECHGECGAKIELAAREKPDIALGIVMSVAELLGWTTRDRGKQTEIYCPFCQKRARRIVEGR